MLGAWFDGEEAPGVAGHLGDCERCRRRVHDLRWVRAAVRSEPVPVSPRRRLAFGGAAVPVAAALAVLVGVAGAPSLSDRLQAARRHLPSPLGVAPAGEPAAAPDGTRLPSGAPASTAPGRSEAAHPAAGPTIGTSAPNRPSGPAATGPAHPAATPASAGAAPTPGAPDLSRALRLGAVLPDDEEAREIARALQRAVELANRSGGVGGRPVELSTAPAHDPGAVLAMSRSVDALVGGAGSAAPGGTPWLFPADPAVGGSDVVPAETPPVEVGVRLADDLEARGIPGAVGAVVGDGPDAGLVDGVASRRQTVRMADDGGTCRESVGALRGRAVSALVVAGPPDLVERCTRAAALLGWRPPGGILVPPSAAYAHPERSPAAQGVRTVLGLPWPDSDTPGANRYRAAVPDGHSYRALVSFAAVELAV